MRSKRMIGFSVGIVACLAAYGVACTSNTTNNTVPTGTPDGSTPTTNPDGSTGDNDGGGTGDGDSGLGPAKPLHAVTGADGEDRITGVYCQSATSCILATETSNSDVHGRLLATDGTTVNTTALVVADAAFSTTVGVIGEVGFLGFSKVGDKLIARTNPGAGSFVSAAGDPSVKANWSTTTVGHATPSDFALNAEYAFGVKGTTWIQIRNSFVYTAPAAPAPATAWTTVWSPGGVGQIPNDLTALKAADATLCISEVGISFSPRPTGAVYVAPDGAIVMYQANGLNQSQTDDNGGVCISTDGGNRFHFAALPALGADLNGPATMTCTSKDHCVVAGGQSFVDNSVYAYVSNNASNGATSTWTKATIPTGLTSETVPYNVFFAPDGSHGWLVGTKGSSAPILWATTDGGATWTDQTASISTLTDNVLWGGFALDATHYIIVGAKGKAMSTL